MYIKGHILPFVLEGFKSCDRLSCGRFEPRRRTGMERPPRCRRAVRPLSDQPTRPKPLKEDIPRQYIDHSDSPSRRLAAHYDGVVGLMFFDESPYTPQVFATNAGTFDLDGYLSLCAEHKINFQARLGSPIPDGEAGFAVAAIGQFRSGAGSHPKSPVPSAPRR